MQTINLTNYLLAIAILLATIFTVSWGVQRMINNAINAQQSSLEQSKRGKFSL